jgi:translation initiation factor IF-2
MTKKRVYELAKELGIDSKDLISRLEKLGIAVKAPQSTLEDTDLEKIQTELLSNEPHEMVEQRIKSTVIRRRAVRPAVEEAKPEPVEAEISIKPEKEKVETAVPKEVKKDKAIPKEPKPKVAAPVEVAPKTVVPEEAKPPEAAKPEEPVVEKKVEIQKKAAEVAEEVPKKPKKKIEVVEKKPAPPEVKEAPKKEAISRQIPKEPVAEAKKEPVKKPELKIVKEMGT